MGVAHKVEEHKCFCENPGVSALECGYVCEQTGRTIRAWELRGTVFVCLADIFVHLELEPQEIEAEPRMINDQLCVTHNTFRTILSNSDVACTEGTPANALKQYIDLSFSSTA